MNSVSQSDIKYRFLGLIQFWIFKKIFQMSEYFGISKIPKIDNFDEKLGFLKGF